MPSFEPLFRAAGGKPIAYLGKTLVMFDQLPLDGGKDVQVTFESAGGKYRQGIRIRADGAMRVNGQLIRGNPGLVFWRDTAPNTFVVELVDTDGPITVYNVWDTGDGTVHSWHNGAAMIVDELPAGRRYHCNDGEPDDDFDDLVFRIERRLA
jgi:hypothetical protein